MLDFTSITPQDIIGSGVTDRDWSERADEEKPHSWHFHIRAADLHACITFVPGDTEDEAADRALHEFVCAWIHTDSDPEGDLRVLFGNESLTFCVDPGCMTAGGHECELTVHVARLEDQRVTESSPAEPVVLMLDLA